MAFVRFFVCYTDKTKKYLTDFDEIVIKGVSRPNLQVIRLWWPKVEGHSHSKVKKHPDGSAVNMSPAWWHQHGLFLASSDLDLNITPRNNQNKD